RPPRQQSREPGPMFGAVDLGVTDDGERTFGLGGVFDAPVCRHWLPWPYRTTFAGGVVTKYEWIGPRSGRVARPQSADQEERARDRRQRSAAQQVQSDRPVICIQRTGPSRRLD